MRVEPFGERITVKVLPIEEVTEGGLVIVSSTNDSNRGEVVAINEETAKHFSIGDKVVFARGTSNSFTDGSDEYRIISINDVLCKIIEDENETK